MNNQLPDIASGQSPLTQLPLRWVGMEAIAIPLKIQNSKEHLASVNAKADVFVSLDIPQAKGIHMSRLYLKLKDTFAD